MSDGIKMRPGVYDADFQVNGISQKGIAFVRGDIVRGFDDRFMYFISSSVGAALGADSP
jgi:hypothetical protein